MKELTVRDLGVKVEEYLFRHEYHVYAVDGLSNEARIIGTNLLDACSSGEM